MGTSGAFFNYKRSMYNLQVYTSNIDVVNYGDTVANHDHGSIQALLELPKGGMGSTLF